MFAHPGVDYNKRSTAVLQFIPKARRRYFSGVGDVDSLLQGREDHRAKEIVVAGTQNCWVLQTKTIVCESCSSVGDAGDWRGYRPVKDPIGVYWQIVCTKDICPR